MSLPTAGEVWESQFYNRCVACGARYRAKYLYVPGDIINVSDHKCDPRRLRRREKQLRREHDDDAPYCECDDLDCKFEYIDLMMNEME